MTSNPDSPRRHATRSASSLDPRVHRLLTVTARRIPPYAATGRPPDQGAIAVANQTSPQEAWTLISRTGSWPIWGPSVSAVEPADAELILGMRGRVRTPIGLWLRFHITGLDPPRSWAWSVLSLPAPSHSVEAAPGGCRVGFSVPAPAFPYLAVCRLALERIAGLLEAPDRR